MTEHKKSSDIGSLRSHFRRTDCGLLLNATQIGGDVARVLLAELEVVGMAGRDAALQTLREFIEIETAAERAERRRADVWAASALSDGVTAGAEFLHNGAAVTDRALRLRAGGTHCRDDDED